MPLGTPKAEAYQIREDVGINLFQTVDAVGQVTEPIRLSRQVRLSVPGTGQTATIELWRSPRDPKAPGGGAWLRVSSVAVSATGNGTSVAEESMAWWQARVVAISGGTMEICLSGRS